MPLGGQATHPFLKDYGRRVGLEENKVRETTVTTAQILALHSTAITVVPDPGTGKFIIIEGCLVFYDYNSAAYAAIAGGDDLSLNFESDASGSQLMSMETTGFLDQTSDQTRWFHANVSNVTCQASEPVAVKLLGAITTGNSPLRIRVYYRIADLAPSTGL